MESGCSGSFDSQGDIETIVEEICRGNELDEEIVADSGAEWSVPWVYFCISSLLDSETGDIIHLPREGSILEQPYRLYSFVQRVQSVWKKVRAERVSKLRQ